MAGRLSEILHHHDVGAGVLVFGHQGKPSVLRDVHTERRRGPDGCQERHLATRESVEPDGRCCWTANEVNSIPPSSEVLCENFGQNLTLIASFGRNGPKRR